MPKASNIATQEYQDNNIAVVKFTIEQAAEKTKGSAWARAKDFISQGQVLNIYTHLGAKIWYFLYLVRGLLWCMYIYTHYGFWEKWSPIY